MAAGMGERGEYLGDGLYVEIKNGMIRLYAPRENGMVHQVFLDADVLQAFFEYLRRWEAMP